MIYGKYHEIWIYKISQKDGSVTSHEVCRSRDCIPALILCKSEAVDFLDSSVCSIHLYINPHCMFNS